MPLAEENQVLTLALDRMEVLRSGGEVLFQGDRCRQPRSRVYPRALRTTLDPQHHRGWWLPGEGLLLPCPLVTGLFASPLAAAMLAVTQELDGAGVFHIDEFHDGRVALTVGENGDNRGMLAQTLRAARRLDDREQLPELFVNILSKRNFPSAQQGLPLAGLYMTGSAVDPLESIPLTAGDVRFIGRLLGKTLPQLDLLSTAKADPFTGPFRTGGHLQFEPRTGERLLPHLTPTHQDRERALGLSSERGRRWLRQKQVAELESVKIDSSSEKAPLRGDRKSAPTISSAFGQLLQFIEEHCTQSLTIPQLARVAHLSPGRLHSAFREAFGCSPIHYVSERRLELAERLLVDTGLSIAEVSTRCGFAEQASLTRTLRRHRGVTPSELRRNGKTGQKNSSVPGEISAPTI